MDSHPASFSFFHITSVEPLAQIIDFPPRRTLPPVPPSCPRWIPGVLLLPPLSHSWGSRIRVPPTQMFSAILSLVYMWRALEVHVMFLTLEYSTWNQDLYGPLCQRRMWVPIVFTRAGLISGRDPTYAITVAPSTIYQPPAASHSVIRFSLPPQCRHSCSNL